MNQADVPKTPMSELNCDLAVSQAIALIKSYSFDTNGTTAEKLVQKWLNNYQGNWVRLATIEALYLGRYKTVSIEQIMEVWLRIGTPNIHFKREFERLICRQLPKHLVISNSSGIETEESLPCKSNNGLNKTSNYDHWQDRESSDLLTSESSPQAELVYPDNKPPKTLSEVKNILKQATRNKRCRDGGSIFPKFGGLEPEIQSNFPPLQGKGAPRDKERASGASALALAKLYPQGQRLPSGLPVRFLHLAVRPRLRLRLRSSTRRGSSTRRVSGLPTQGIPIRGQARTKRGTPIRGQARTKRRAKSNKENAFLLTSHPRYLRTRLNPQIIAICRITLEKLGTFIPFLITLPFLTN